MPFKEFIEKTKNLKNIQGDFGVWHIYTSGIAGEKFFEGLLNGKLVGSRCSNCGITFLPPKIYCEDCFEKIEDFHTLDSNTGYLYTWTYLYKDLEDNYLPEPLLIGFITFENTKGGLIHFIGEIERENITPGIALEPVFIEERKGSILDIKYFRPLK